MLARILTATVAATLLGTSSALAATPPTLNVPDAASVAAGKPTFTWTNGPTGETLRSISFSTSNALTAEGDLASLTGGEFLSELEAATSATASRVHYAGRYFFVGYWRTPDFSSRGYTPLQSFVVPSSLKAGRTSLIQYSSIPATNITAPFVTNVRRVVGTCSIFNGRRLVGTQKRVIDYTTPQTVTRLYCSNIRVPEGLDGARLKLVVKIVGGGKAATTVTYFRAK